MMDHTNCQELLESISEYLDGMLGMELCQEIERHMSGCEDCRIVVDTLRKTLYLYRQANDRVDVPQEVRQRLFHRLDLDDFTTGSS
jgi:anti-sigma factor (TIGR02949 family)